MYQERQLLKALYKRYGFKDGATAVAIPQELRASGDTLADELYDSCCLLPRSYCDLAFCIKILQISSAGTRQRSQTIRLWEYVVYAMLDDADRAGFDAAFDSDLERLRERQGHPKQLEFQHNGTRDEQATLPLRDLSSSMLRR